MNTAHHAAPNIHREPSLLSAEAQRKWRGFPIGWFQTRSRVTTRDYTLRSGLLGMLDSGSAVAEFSLAGRTATHNVTPGTMGYFAAGTEVQSNRWRGEPGRRIVVQLDFDRISGFGLPDSLRRAPTETDTAFQDEDLSRVLRSMVREVADGCPNGPLFAESLSLGLALRLQQRTGTPQARERGKLTAAQAQHLEALVRTELAGDVSLARLADAAGFSPVHFVRLFRNTFGCTPHQFVLRARLARARELAVGSGQPLAAVAQATGFASQSHMTAAFVRAFGVPPGEMRRQAGTRLTRP